MSYGEFLKHAQQAGLVFAKSASATPAAPATIVVPEGQQLTVKGAAGSTGSVARAGSTDSWPIGASATVPIRAFAGTQRFVITSTGGSIDATVADAALGAALRTTTVQPRKIVAASVRDIAVVLNAAITSTMMIHRQAPDHFDSVQVTINGIANSANPIKVTVAVTDVFGNGYNPKTAGANSTWVPVTFGTTQRQNPRNPGGGATEAIVSNASGSAGAPYNLIESDLVSDIIPLASLERTDIVGAKPLIHARVYGINIPCVQIGEASPISPNPWSSVLGEYYNGYWTGDQTTNQTVGNVSGPNFNPAITLTFYLRGRAVYAIGAPGDSIEQGWIRPNAVPQTGGLINGWPRRLASLLNAKAGRTVATVEMMCYQGQRSGVFHERAINAILAGRLTHCIIKPWSVNEAPEGFASVAPALRRANHLIQLCLANNVLPLVVMPNDAQMATAAIRNAITNWCNSVAASGIRVMDFRAAMDHPSIPFQIKPEFCTLNADGSVADTLHPNDAGQAVQGQAAYDQSFDLFP